MSNGNICLAKWRVDKYLPGETVGAIRPPGYFSINMIVWYSLWCVGDDCPPLRTFKQEYLVVGKVPLIGTETDDERFTECAKELNGSTDNVKYIDCLVSKGVNMMPYLDDAIGTIDDAIRKSLPTFNLWCQGEINNRELNRIIESRTQYLLDKRNKEHVSKSM